MNRILLTEDDNRVASFIRKGLEENGYLAHVAITGTDGLTEAGSTDYDAIILDVMLPDMDGFDVCAILRKRGITTPVIMLSALNSPEEKIKGLQCGADDYLSKPFLFEELLARIQAQLRRMEFNRGITDIQRYAGIEINMAEQCAFRDGKDLKLSPREFKLLAFLVRNREKAISRPQIAQSVWDIHFSSNTNVVDVYINYLRRKLDKDYTHPLIHTVKGRGYMLKQKDHEPAS